MLSDRILTYVTKMNGLVSLNKLVSVSAGAGFSEDETLAAIDKLGKKLKATVRGNDVYYSIPPPKKITVSHLALVRENYVSIADESPFKVCDCYLTHLHWRPELGHFPTCDSILYPEEYKEQNPWDITAGVPINQVEYDKVVIQSKHKYGKKKVY
jgi:hypothetical protein